MFRIAIVIAVLLMSAAALYWTNPGRGFETSKFISWASSLRNSPLGLLAAVGAFVLGGLAMVPVTAIIAATVIVFGPWMGFAYSICGSMASAMTVYMLGRVFFAGRYLNRQNRMFKGQEGIVMVAATRIFPFAPFTIMSLVLGSAHILYRNFILGTLLGMVPWILALAIFTDRAANAIQNPGVGSILSTVGILILLVFSAFWLRGRFKRENGRQKGD